MCVLRSKEFDDVYFSAVDGLAETRHVFLDGNGVPEAWGGVDEFVIAETGFGTGLNFLAVWKLFTESAAAGQRLRFISVEKFPLSRDDIAGALSHWPELAEQREAFLAAYDDVLACGRGVFGDVTLELHLGDVKDVLPRWDVPVNAWFLDGFKPSTNPDMWSDFVFGQMARLSDVGTSFATFTAAGFVRRGLAGAGFEVRKVKGFGTKRDMSVGVFSCE
ncbi:MAG: tRNA (5-methylaminomethyl-2-thiouridine)(34)-methyltransferase MnmD [Alphaproteobacteria bacterium]